MDQASEKPRILLLRAPLPNGDEAGMGAHWERLKKTLGAFAELRENEFTALAPEELEAHVEAHDHVFLDYALAPWSWLATRTHSRLTLVSAPAFETGQLEEQVRESIVRHSCLILEGIGAADLLRVLHLHLLPKRLAGVAPLMEKGSLILGEKVMDDRNLGALLDRLAATFGQLGHNEIPHRTNDLRQALSALIFEGLACARSSETLFPSVDFQAASSGKKLAVTLRFPRGRTAADKIAARILDGREFFWHQAWQCADLLLLTHHLASDELEVTLLLCQDERAPPPQFRSLLFKSSAATSQRENLLDPPQSYSFKLLSDIRPPESDYVRIESERFEESAGDIDFSSVPENVAKGLHELREHCRALSRQVSSKEGMLKEAFRNVQEAQRELSLKRGELVHALRVGERNMQEAQREISSLESKLEQLKRAPKETGPKGPDSTARLETMLRMAENEKAGMRDAIAYEQKRVAAVEQRYSALFRDIALKEREINDLKTALTKFKKGTPTGKPEPTTAPSAELALLVKQADQRESYYKQELQAAKEKQAELLKRISELVSSLKKSGKAA